MPKATGRLSVETSNVVLRRPVLSTAVAILGIVFGARAVNRVHPLDDVGWDWWSVGVLMFVAYGLVMAFAFGRLPGVTRRPEELVIVSWTFAMAPSLIAFAAATSHRVHKWAFLGAVSMSVLGIAIVTLVAVRSRDVANLDNRT